MTTFKQLTHIALIGMLFAACASDEEQEPPTSTTEAPVVVNGGFETGTLGSWTTTTSLNSTGLLVVPPTSTTDLQLAAGGKNFTFARTSATPLVPPGMVAGAGVPLYPRFGTTSAVVNEYGSGNPPGDTNHQGANQNVNSLKQSFVTTNADLDPQDGKVHVRFVLAPELEAAGHVPSQQPYFFVVVRNLTAPRAGDLYTNFNFSNQPGIPWQSQGTGATALLFTDWQLFDIAPTDDKFVVGDTLEVEVYASGCQPGGHSGSVYLDGFGAQLDSLSIAKSVPTQANVNADIRYTFLVQNNAAVLIPNVTADEILPRDTTFVSVSAPGATCTTPPVGGTGTVSCTYATLAAGASRTFTIVVHNNTPPAPGAGTATAATASTLSDSSKTWVVNQWGGQTVYITGGVGAGQQATILTNTATQLTVVPNWATTPTATSTYVIINPPGTNVTPSTTVTSATTTTLTLAAAGWNVDQWKGWTASILSGPGAAQVATIVSNTATTLTVSPAWTVTPTAASQFLINMTGTSGLGTGQSSGNTGNNNDLQQNNANWVSNQWIGWTVTILSGTGAGQQRAITRNTFDTLTIAPNWTTRPNNTSVFAINLPVDKVTNGNYGVASPTISRLLGPSRSTVLTSGVTFADLSITKSDGVAAVVGNGSMTYTIVVKNNGPSAATGAVVKDTFPAALATHAWTCAGASCNATSGNTDINETVNLAAGATITYTVAATLNIATGTVTNLATVTAPGTVVDNNPGDNADGDTDDVGVLRTLTVNKDPSSTGTGEVVSTPISIDCAAGCTTQSGVFLTGSTVTLHAIPDPGTTFLGWTGACASFGTAPVCTLTMTGDLVAGVVFSTCGNGVLDPTEGCYDSNTANGDGCNAACKVETSFTCNATVPGLTGDPSCASGACDSVGNAAPGKCEVVGCGDGHLAAGEGCDDGNTTSGDGCNATCKVENTFACNATAPGAVGDTSCASGTCDAIGNGAPGKCEAAGCGDGHLAAAEGCDDGNVTNGDGCNAACKVETSFTCNATAPGLLGDSSCATGGCDAVGNPAPGKCEVAGCGDGKLAAGEGCDDGNTTNGDGCNATCKKETGQACNT
ncbi:MAG: DUF4215 domain-containing protein, partial [Proteobacteria bacterium]|nr:DUF4215 domain-containing protein [Pseudomonadota bacterium]